MNAMRACTGRRIAILGAGREGRAVLGWLRVHEPDAELTCLASVCALSDTDGILGLGQNATHLPEKCSATGRKGHPPAVA